MATQQQATVRSTRVLVADSRNDVVRSISIAVPSTVGVFIITDNEVSFSVRDGSTLLSIANEHVASIENDIVLVRVRVETSEPALKRFESVYSIAEVRRRPFA